MAQLRTWTNRLCLKRTTEKPVICLCLAIAISGALGGPSHGGPRYCGGLTIGYGYFSELRILDTDGDEWNSFDGDPFQTLSAFCGLGWRGYALDARIAQQLTPPFLSGELIMKGGQSVFKDGGLRQGGVSVSRCLTVGSQADVAPRLGYTAADIVAVFELVDVETNLKYREVDYSRFESGGCIGLHADLWFRSDTLGNYISRPKLQVSYDYASILGGMHVAEVELKVFEAPDGRAVEFLIGRASLGPSVRSVSIGFGGAIGNR
jgi:hypothetical protein